MLNALAPDLLSDLRNALLATECFDSDAALFALFVDARIAPWRYRCKASSSKTERVDFLIETLYDSQNANGDNALVLFLAVLKDRYPPEDARYNQFAQLIHRLTPNLTDVSTRPLLIPFINRENESERIRQETDAMQYWIIHAPSGYGKTTFLSEITGYYLKKNWSCAQIEISKRYTPKLHPLIEIIIQALGEAPSFTEDATPENIGFELAGCISRLAAPDNGAARPTASDYGVAVILDNVDALDDITLQQFIKVIMETFTCLDEGDFFNNLNHFCLLMAGREARRITAAFHPDIIVRNMGLSPYTYKYVHETVRRYVRETGRTLQGKKIQEIASQLLYYGGGHPGCIAMLLTTLTRTRFAGYQRVLADKTKITQPVFGALKDFETALPDPTLFPILETLSVFRRIDRASLEYLRKRCFIPQDRTSTVLERQLAATHLSMNKEMVLTDSITRYLLLIRFRMTQAEAFANICEAGLELYRTRLSGYRLYPAFDALEYLYLCIQQACHVHDLHGKDLRDIIDQQISRIVAWFEKVYSAEDAEKLVFQFGRELAEDWEIAFLADYFLKFKKPRFCSIVTDFNQQHSAFTQDEATP